MKIIPLYQPKKLANLVRLCLTVNLLEVNQFHYLVVDKDVVASTNSCQPEAKSLNQGKHLCKSDVF